MEIYVGDTLRIVFLKTSERIIDDFHTTDESNDTPMN